MRHPRIPKMTITLSVDPTTWQAYRKLCQDHDRIPSHEFEAFMKQQLAAKQHQAQKESDHA